MTGCTSPSVFLAYLSEKGYINKDGKQAREKQEQDEEVDALHFDNKSRRASCGQERNCSGIVGAEN